MFYFKHPMIYKMNKFIQILYLNVHKQPAKRTNAKTFSR